jgi:hypothetical protein
MTTPVRNKALEIQAWCARLGVPMLGNELMIGDYIDTRWPALARHVRKVIFEAAAKHKEPTT